MASMRQQCCNIYGKLTENAEWMMTFLTYGDDIRDSKHSNATEDNPSVESSPGFYRKKYNGLIASMDVLVALLTFALMVSLTPHLAQDITKASTNCVPEIILIVLMIVGLIMLFLFSKVNDVIVRRNSFGQRIHRFKNLDRVLLIVGLIVFYTFSFVLDLFYCIAQLECGREWMTVNGTNAMFEYVVDIIFHLVRTIYLGCSTLFIVIYGHASFANKCWVRYGLVILFGSNLAIWFDVLLHESASSLNNTMSISRFGINCSSNTSIHENTRENKTIDCVCYTTKFFGLIRYSISPICFPFMYECSVMIGERFLHWFSNCSSKLKISKKKLSTKINIPNSSSTGDNNPENQANFNRLITSNTSFLSSELIASVPYRDVNSSDDESEFTSDEGLGDSNELEDIYDPHYSNDSGEEEQAEYQSVTDEGNQILIANDHLDVVMQAQTFRNNHDYENISSKCQNCRNAGRFICRCDVLTQRRTISSNLMEQEVSSEEPPLQDKPPSMLMYTLFFLVTISTNVLLLISSLLPFLFRKHEKGVPYSFTAFNENSEDFEGVKHFFLYYSMFYYHIVLLVTIIGFVVVRNFPIRRSRHLFHGLDYMLLISACGPFAYNVLSLVAIVYDSSILTKKGLGLYSSLLLQFINLLEVYVQIPFCFYSGRVMALNSDGTRRPGAKYFQAILIYLSVSNATLWLVNSFATTFNGINVYYARDLFLEAWDIINGCVLPITLFFRFNSALLLLKALRMAFQKPRAHRITS